MNDSEWLESDPEVTASLERAESDVQAGRLKPWHEVKMKKKRRTPEDLPWSAIFSDDGNVEISTTIPREVFSELAQYAKKQKMGIPHAISALIRLHLSIESFDPETAEERDRIFYLQEFDGLLKRVSQRFKEFDETGGASESEIMDKINSEKTADKCEKKRD